VPISPYYQFNTYGAGGHAEQLTTQFDPELLQLFMSWIECREMIARE
jgi:hypothetical protein